MTKLLYTTIVLLFLYACVVSKKSRMLMTVMEPSLRVLIFFFVIQFSHNGRE
jgi:hypothetical protein